MQGIYVIKNLINNKCYIGSSIDIYRRFRTHKYLLNNNKHHSLILQRAWNKYGSDGFKFIIVGLVDNELLLEKIEQHYIDNNSSEYNVCKVAGNKSGFIHSEITKLKISKANTGKIKSIEQKQILSKLNIGKKHSEATKLKISQALLGKKRKYSSDFIKNATERLRPFMIGLPKGFKHSDESKAKMRNSHIGLKQSEITKQKRAKTLSKEINQYDKVGNFIKTWDSIKEAGDILNISCSQISGVLKGIKKSAKGYTFKYK